MKRWLVSGGIVASGVAFVAAVVVCVLVGSGGVAVAGLAGDLAWAGRPAPRAAPSPWAEPSPSVSPAAEEQPAALFVGDSYTVGEGASSPERRWSTLVAEEMGWHERNVADGGTGFASRWPERDLLSYQEQLRSVRPGDVDVVVIAGGQNDFDDLRDDAPRVFRAVTGTYELARQRFPDAQIVAVGPSTPWAVGLEARALDSAVRAAAHDVGATYVPLLDPNLIQGRLVHEDGVHATDAGNAAIARRVLEALHADLPEAGVRTADILTSR